MIKTINGEFRDREHYIRVLEVMIERKDQDNIYKKAWEDLKAIYNHDDTKSKNEIMILGKIKEVEKRCGIEVSK